MKKIAFFLIIGIILGFSQSVFATTISFSTNNLGGNHWEYTYSVINDTLGFDIEEFTIWFDLGLYENLTPTATPDDWDPIGINPDPDIPDDGYYDAFALVAGIASGETLNGFSVSFDYLGTGTPGSQLFEIVDLDFNMLDSGETTAASAPVPEPATIFLIGTGLVGLTGLRRKNRK